MMEYHRVEPNSLVLHSPLHHAQPCNNYKNEGGNVEFSVSILTPRHTSTIKYMILIIQVKILSDIIHTTQSANPTRSLVRQYTVVLRTNIVIILQYTSILFDLLTGNPVINKASTRILTYVTLVGVQLIRSVGRQWVPRINTTNGILKRH